ncbi:MAG: hypothetical protein HY909_08010 [Deltaproteobacteria bacterium]|nr:hypothetical protein [Deltaproteobacteria bacterium]
MLRRQYDELTGEYETFFAGQSRATRELPRMDALLSRLKALRAQVDQARGGGSNDLKALREELQETFGLYETERKAIVEAKSLGPDFVEFSELGGAANLTFSRYLRHFSGKSRNTRDLGLLAEMIADLTSVKEAMQDLLPRLPSGVPGAREDLKVVEDNRKMYLSERGEIVDSRAEGSAEEQAGVLGEVANGQFKLYQDHFAGRSRVTRRPALLQRMVDNLKQVHDRMKVLRQGGLTAEFHTRNMTIVEEALAQYTAELTEVRKVREATALTDLLGQLGLAANEVMDDYGKHFEGQDRKTRSLELLSALCDRLGEVGRQMEDFARFEDNEMNNRNLAIVTANRRMLEREYTLIEEAQKTSVH